MQQSPRASGTISAVTVFGVPLRFHFTFLLLLGVLLTAGFGGRRTVLLDVVFIICLFLSVLLHELGHAVTARAYGIRTLEIVMYPIGGVARLERQARPAAEFWISLAGPLVNVLIAALLYTISAAATAPQSDSLDLLDRIAAANFYLALFNLTPAFPMDGGRILRAGLALWKGEASATRIATTAGRVIAVLMGIYGLISGEIFLLFIAFLIFSAASQEGAASAGRALTRGFPVHAAMITDFHTLSHGATLQEAAQLLIATPQRDFPVTHGEQLIGLLDRNIFLRPPSSIAGDTYVSELMTRDFPRVPPNADLADVLPYLTPASPCAVVMDGERLLGLLTRENIAEFLTLHRYGVARPATSS